MVDSTDSRLPLTAKRGNNYGAEEKMFEAVVHGIFLLLGLITVGCVLLITVYLIISGIPAIQKIGLVPFLTVCAPWDQGGMRSDGQWF